MPTLTVKNPTVADGESLCRTCSHVHMQRGYRESDEVVFCTYASWNAPRLVPFKVRDCTDYTDRDTPSRDQLEEMAILIEPRSAAKAPGFTRDTGNSTAQVEK
jgi:hypothetical protein